jgi:hypothetical protein
MPIVLRIAINLGIFDLFNEEDQADREFDAPEIASLTKTDERLICKRTVPFNWQTIVDKLYY